MNDTRKVHIVCPNCASVYDVDVPFTEFTAQQLEKGLVTLSLKIGCGHSCYVFIDKNFKQRGGQCADIDIDSENAQFVPLSNAQFQASELLLKYASEVIKMDVADADLIKKMNAEERVGIFENALIHGDIMKAGRIIGDLRDLAKEVGDFDYADRLAKRIFSLHRLTASKPDLDWQSLVLYDSDANTEFEYAAMRAIHYERLRGILAGLEYEVIEGRLSREAVDAKKQQLIDLMDTE